MCGGGGGEERGGRRERGGCRDLTEIIKRMMYVQPQDSSHDTTTRSK